MVKKLVLETKIKQIDGNVETLIDTNEYVQEITNKCIIQDVVIPKNSTYTVLNAQSGEGVRVLIVHSDIPLALSYDIQGSQYDLAVPLNEIKLAFTGEYNTIGSYGTITLQNYDMTENANAKIIFCL